MRRLLAVLIGAALALPCVVAKPAWATLTDTSNGRRIATGDGATLVYVFTFPAVNTGDLVASVVLNGTPQVISYSVALNSDQIASPGGTVTFGNAPPNLSVVTIQRNEALTQNTTLTPFFFPAKTVEKTFDSVVRKIQQIDRDRADLAAKEVTDISNVIAGGIGAASLLAPTATGAPSNATLADRFSDLLNAKRDYGAVGSGLTDDSSAAQNGITAAAGRPIRFPKGTYKITAGLTIPCGSHVIGDGETDNGGTKFVFSGLGASVDAVTVQYCAPTNADQGSLIKGIKFDCGSSGRDCVRFNGGRLYAAEHIQVVNSARDGFVIAGDTGGHWTEGVTVKDVLILNTGRHCIHLDTTAGAVAYINHVNWENVHTQACGTVPTPGNSIRVDVLANANNGVLFQNFFNLETAQNTIGAAPDGIFINGASPAYVQWWSFITGEQESTLPGTTTGYVINASNAGVVSQILYQNIFQDPDYVAGQWGPNIGTHSWIGGSAAFSGLDVLSGYAQRFLGTGGSSWSAAQAGGFLSFTGNFGVNSYFVTTHDTPATGAANFNSPRRRLCGNVWNGATSIQDCWDMQITNGAGANPTSVLNFTHTGSTGASGIGLPPVTFGNLGAPPNLTIVGCSDCTIANPCAGGGTGAMAKRLNGVWVCN